MWIIPLFTHLFANTGFNAILRHAASDRKIDSFWLATIMQTSIAIPAVVGIFFFKINWGLINANTLPFYICVLIMAPSVMMLNAKALEHTEASVFAFLYNLRIAFATFFGIALFSEPVIPLSITGAVFVFAAGLIIAGKSTAKPLGIVFSVATAVLMTTLNAFEKYLINEVGYITYMFPVTIISGCIFWAIIVLQKRKVDFSFIKTRECSWLMIARSVSAYGFTLAFAFGAVLSVSVYISSLTTVTIPIAAIIFLKETSGLKRKIIAGIVALIGVTLIFLAG